MPRIRVYYHAYDPKNSNDTDNDPQDFCRFCWLKAVSNAKNNPLAEITEDDHPDYDDTDYRCAICGRTLTDKDN